MEHVGNLAEAEDVLSPTIIPLFGLLSPPAEQEETCHFCFETITKGHSVYGTQIAMLRTSHSHRLLQDMGIYIPKRFHRTLCLLQNCLPIRRHLFPLPTGIHRKTQLHKVLPHKSPRGMHRRSHSPALTPNLRTHARMWTTYRM